MSTSTSQGWYSIVGYLYMKPAGGAFSLLKPRKRMYFALEETESSLVFFKDEIDFVKKKEPLGTIPLVNAACTLVESSNTAFAIHSEGRKYDFDADNESSAERWMNALQNRRESVDLNENIRKTSRPGRRCGSCARSRSTSLPSESDLRSGRLYKGTEKKQGASIDDYPHLPSFNCKRRVLHRLQSVEIPSGGITSTEDCTRGNNIKKERRKTIPAWLDEWITGWLNEQPFMDPDPDKSTIEDKKILYMLREASQSANDEAASSTSTYDSSQCSSSSSSDQVVSDELNRLRVINNRQKERIQELNEEKKKLIVEVSQMKEFQHATAERINDNYKASLAAQNKFLNAEVLRLSERSEAEQKTIQKLKQKKLELEEDLNSFKREYVFLLQSCIRIPLSDQHSVDVVQVKLFGGDVHKKRVLRLLDEARSIDPTLPTFESVVVLGNYVDAYGYRHSFEDEGLALHYICTLLHDHYRTRSQTQVIHRKAWNECLQKCNRQLCNTRDLRQLVRAGIPSDLRTTVWKLLIHQQVSDIKKQYGKYYYRNLCNSHGTAAERQYSANHQKQITLDLLRTMPTNIHFMSPTCKGIQQLEQVLRAFCIHNPSIGYCQGMNFLASTAMLFVGAEDTFWFLVAVTEKYFDKSFFDQSLTGAQADQEVLKELLDSRLPRLSAHLDACGIDLATVTLNWFLALFFDAVPFQTMIRIWDCFLLEGPKVLFRFAVALLSLHESEVLQRTDTISVMKILKASVRLTYDCDGLFNLAFDKSQPFPSRDQIEQKQKGYLSVLHERLSRRKQLQATLSSNPSNCLSNSPTMELLTFCGTNEDIGYICSGTQTKGIISQLKIDNGSASLHKLSAEFECRIISMTIPNESIAFVSLLSGYIVALQFQELSFEILWELKLSDVALKMHCVDGSLYAALANGTLTVIENVTKLVPTELQIYHLPIAAAPIMDMAVVDDNLWLAVACKVVIINIASLKTLKRIYVASPASGSGLPLFEKIRCMSESPYGVWLVTAHSTLIQLWTDSECRLLFDVSYDHSNKKPSLSDIDEKQEIEITVILFVREQVWIGTTDGYLIIYDVRNGICSKEVKDTMVSQKKKYPAGRRLSPKSGSVCDVQPLPSYYIPTDIETKHDESASGAEYGADRVAHKISVFIDYNTKKSAGSKSISKKISNNSNIDSPRFSLTVPPSSETNTTIQRGNHAISNAPNQQNRRHTLFLPNKRSSISSATSVFSSDDNCENVPLSAIQQKRHGVYAENESHRKNNGILTRSSTAPSYDCSSQTGAGLSMHSSIPSMEYDDLFELYSEDDGTLSLNSSLFHSETTSSAPPALATVDKPSSSVSKDVEPPADSASSCPTLVSSSASTSSNQAASKWYGFSNTAFKLRRRDLEFDEMLDAPDPFDDMPVQSTNDQTQGSEGSANPSGSSAITLVLDMKMKISDKPVKCARPTRIGDETVVVTCAGDYGDMESVLKWTSDHKDTGNELWINDPILDVHYKRLRSFHETYPV